MSFLPSHSIGPTPSSMADENEVAILDSKEEPMNEDDSSRKSKENKLTSKVWLDMDRVTTANGIWIKGGEWSPFLS